ncbi:MAG: hypothetical protein V2I82_12575 [Halieaceae bacterium]|jgi:hypothetical protein|nr:hypothetical protein [Halieaceae bacterium]
MSDKNLLLAAIAAIAVGFSPSLLAAGGQNGYNNPKGDIPDDTYNEPFANYDNEGRMMVFCAEDELLVVVPAEGGALEITCQVVD